jgi:16S rRNA (guanine1207-N2)-methyltransferase
MLSVKAIPFTDEDCVDRVLAGRDRANRMFDAYGGLLTARQQLLLERYYKDDLSLGEIAAQMRVSRQAVHDGLRRALGALERFESALGLAQKAIRGERVPQGRSARANGETSPQHYSTPTPGSPPRPRLLQAVLRGRPWMFEAASGVFAHRRVDMGTRVLIDAMRIAPDDRVLDLGCGYGPIGIVAGSLASRGRVYLIDVNRRAVALARANADRNALGNVRVMVGDAAAPIHSGAVDVVLTNPPIRQGRTVVLRFIEDAWRVLAPGGRFYFVARTAQGAKTLARLVGASFGDVRKIRTAAGYRVYEAIKREIVSAGAAGTREARSV